MTKAQKLKKYLTDNEIIFKNYIESIGFKEPHKTIYNYCILHKACFRKLDDKSWIKDYTAKKIDLLELKAKGDGRKYSQQELKDIMILSEEAYLKKYTFRSKWSRRGKREHILLKQRRILKPPRTESRRSDEVHKVVNPYCVPN